MDKAHLCDSIRASWSRGTSADPGLWSEENPSRGQCDVTSLVVMEYLGGDLQMAKVYLGDEQTEHHFWNQLTDKEPLDLTREQFIDGQSIGEPELLTHDFVRTNYSGARQELRDRHDRLRRAVATELGADAAPDLLTA